MGRSLLLLTPDSNPVVRILFFPHAGGTALHLRAWAERLPPFVQLLGVRYTAWDNPAAQIAPRTSQSIVADLVADIVAQSDRPMIFFGYSLGALIAYETCVELCGRGIDSPAELVVAASRAPDQPRREVSVTELTDAELIARLRHYGGTPESVLQDPDLLDALLPAIRADFSVVDSYRMTQPMRLRCPITAMAGNTDPLATVDAVGAWRSRTTSTFNLHRFAGGHFFLHEQPQRVLSIVESLANRYVTNARDALDGRH